MSPVENQKSKRRKSALIILSFIFLLPLASPQEEYEYNIESYSIYFDIISDNTVKETIEISLTANTNFSRYVFYSDYPVENPDAIVKVNGEMKIVNVSVSKVIGGINAVYVKLPPVHPGDRVDIKLSFYSSGMLQDVQNKKQFAYYIKFSQPVGVFYVRLFVPRGYAILSPIIPSPDMVESSENRLVLEWRRENIKAGEEFYFIVGFSGEIKGFSPLWLIVIFVSAFVGGFFAGVLYKERKGKEKVEILKSDEEKVIELLKNGPILQSELVKRLGVSKAKVSLLLKEMEKKGLIERVKEGRSYLVRLKQG
ncbi:MAG TPA: MarR family transcriptional regulator [Thermococcus paralvinellae]|uniref:MarR family transcriptional regulator n=1 Tax=Thermococcus paralvinellae TaxID=582419 RepID=A0A833E1X3_9EURY|nr:MarR family transcriptional regulator [Thermococcus paralvinellae]